MTTLEITHAHHVSASIRLTDSTALLVGVRQGTGNTTAMPAHHARCLSCEAHFFYRVLPFPAEKSLNTKSDGEKHHGRSDIATDKYHCCCSPMRRQIDWRERPWLVNCKSTVRSRNTRASKPIENAEDNEAEGMQKTPFDCDQPQIPRHIRIAAGIKRHSSETEVHGLYRQCRQKHNSYFPFHLHAESLPIRATAMPHMAVPMIFFSYRLRILTALFPSSAREIDATAQYIIAHVSPPDFNPKGEPNAPA